MMFVIYAGVSLSLVVDQMGRRSRDSSDAAIVGTSIALLKERFRQLQKDKQRRREQELLKLLMGTERNTPHVDFDHPRTPFSPSRALQDSLSLSLNLQIKPPPQHMAAVNGNEVWPRKAASPATSRNMESCDVDTTLHL